MSKRVQRESVELPETKRVADSEERVFSSDNSNTGIEGGLDERPHQPPSTEMPTFRPTRRDS